MAIETVLDVNGQLLMKVNLDVVPNVGEILQIDGVIYYLDSRQFTLDTIVVDSDTPACYRQYGFKQTCILILKPFIEK